MAKRLLVLAILATLTATALAQTSEPAPHPLPLRAELKAERTLVFPQTPIRLRFTLVNPTDEVVEFAVPALQEPPTAITLPRSIAFGTADSPALSVVFEHDPPVDVGAIESDAESQVTLRLAPHSSVGAVYDIASLHRMFRYPGVYHVTWSPLGGHVPAATATVRVEGRKVAILVTDYGKVKFSLMYNKAPQNVANFLELAREKFYDGKLLHRIVSGYIIQGGSPDGTSRGMRPDGKTVPAEFHDAPFIPGTLAMAHKPDEPDSASCQFFISLSRLPQLDGKYTVIGQATDEESLQTLRKLAELATDRRGRPLRPVIIRFFTIRDAD